MKPVAPVRKTDRQSAEELSGLPDISSGSTTCASRYSLVLINGCSMIPADKV